MMGYRENQIRHTRVLDLRKKILRGWNMKSLLHFCEMNLKVSRVTAVSYIDEAAGPYRKKYEAEKSKK